MKKETIERLISLGRILFHASIPIIAVIIILNVWTVGLSNDATMEWNIFITVACFGAACLMILVALFIEFVAWRYRYT